MAAKIKTYVSSNTYDTLLNIMYPDDEAKDRTIQEVERLIVQGHTVEYRFGSNMSVVLDIDKFNEFIRPKFAEDPTPINTQEEDLKNQLSNMTPVAPENVTATAAPELVLNDAPALSLLQETLNKKPTVQPATEVVKEGKPAEEPEEKQTDIKSTNKINIKADKKK